MEVDGTDGSGAVKEGKKEEVEVMVVNIITMPYPYAYIHIFSQM